MLAACGGSMAALAIFTAVFAYADLMWPLICNTDLNMMTLPTGGEPFRHDRLSVGISIKNNLVEV